MIMFYHERSGNSMQKIAAIIPAKFRQKNGGISPAGHILYMTRFIISELTSFVYPLSDKRTWTAYFFISPGSRNFSIPVLRMVLRPSG